MLKISEKANKNYLAKIVKLTNVQKHPNADRLKTTTIDFQNVVTGPDAKEGDMYVYFPLESALNVNFLSNTNAFRDKELNQDKEQTGFFEKNGRVRAVKLRGEKSMGYIVPLHVVESFTGKYLGDRVGEEFDTIGDILMLEKYVVRTRERNSNGRQGKKPRISRLVEGQVKLHVDTENLRKNAFQINPEDYISITFKTHGTSWWVANLLVKKRLNFFLKFLKKIGIPVNETEYDYVYGSRKVVKNEFETEGKNHFYGTDVWSDIKDDVKEFIPKGFTLYGEALGYVKTGKEIQKGYDYGCKIGEKRIQVYRITFTNEDGLTYDLSTQQVKEFCERFGLEYVHLFYFGKAKDLYGIDTENHWHKEFIQRLEADYNEKDCFMCVNKVPEEGIVLRKETLFSFESFKLKSFRFLEYETELLDKGESDMESEQSEII